MSMFVRGCFRFAIAAAALTLCAASHAGVWYVDKSNASGTEDGTSWTTAFSTIQPAIDAAPEIEAALGRLRFVAELYGDLDEDGLPEIASLRLLETAACAYDTSKGFAAERAFELNLNAVDDEPFDMRILRKRELIAALMAVGEETSAPCATPSPKRALCCSGVIPLSPATSPGPARPSSLTPLLAARSP